MKALKAILMSTLLAHAVPAVAGENMVVVELFTSQGCSSCPPADALMHKLVAKDHVIALSLHVDYWDYIGWKDRFADPAFSKRQKAYAAQGGRNMVYTPQMIVNGQDQVVGAHAMELSDLIMMHADRPSMAEVALERDGGILRVGLLPLASSAGGDFVVELMRYTEQRSVDITRGENAGRHLTYLHVVDHWETVGQWDGRSAEQIEVPIEGDRPVVILIQERGPGAIVAAAQLR